MKDVGATIWLSEYDEAAEVLQRWHGRGAELPKHLIDEMVYLRNHQCAFFGEPERIGNTENYEITLTPRARALIANLRARG